MPYRQRLLIILVNGLYRLNSYHGVNQGKPALRTNELDAFFITYSYLLSSTFTKMVVPYHH